MESEGSVDQRRNHRALGQGGTGSGGLEGSFEYSLTRLACELAGRKREKSRNAPHC